MGNWKVSFEFFNAREIFQNVCNHKNCYYNQNYFCRFPGWPKETGGALTSMGAHLDLSPFSSPEELMSLGLDRLKSALLALGLKCGGTLEERAHRLFSTKGKSLTELDPSLFSKSKNSDKSSKNKESAKARDTALIESQIYWLAELLNEQRAATKENVQRKQARRDGEQDEEEEVSADESEEETEDEVPYNPKNLPLGWDGKPIPYWLYKLHGLNISYNCEICGNYTYKGPKAFQRHFAEWRHAHGMRCLSKTFILLLIIFLLLIFPCRYSKYGPFRKCDANQRCH